MTAIGDFYPAAAAAPTDPSFLDSYLNKQRFRFSRIFLWILIQPTKGHLTVRQLAVKLIEGSFNLTCSLLRPFVKLPKNGLKSASAVWHNPCNLGRGHPLEFLPARQERNRSFRRWPEGN